MKVLEFYDFCREHKQEIHVEDDIWALARARQETGDRKLMQFLLSRRDLPQLLARVSKAEQAPDSARRLRMNRVQILEAAAANAACVCSTPQLTHPHPHIQMFEDRI